MSSRNFYTPCLAIHNFSAYLLGLFLPKNRYVRFHSLPNLHYQKNYVPDYLIFFYGYPVLVIEAKSPAMAATVAITEARLYAHALNDSFPAGTNPISIVCGCNGRELLIGSWDSVNYEKFSC